MTTAYDEDGSVMEPIIINTISPISYAEQARAISAYHMYNVENSPAEPSPETMLPISLGKNGVVTHIWCSRESYPNALRRQLATMTAEYLNGNDMCIDGYYTIDDNPEEIKTKFCTVVGNENEILSFLDLEKM